MPERAEAIEPERVPCPDCNGRGKVAGVVPGVPADVCTKLTPCERCWPRKPDGSLKFWNDGTAGTIVREGGSLLRTPRPPAEQVKSDRPRTASENADGRVGPDTAPYDARNA